MLDEPHPGLPGNEIVRRIEKALACDGTHTWDDVREMIIDGRAQIFWNQHGCWITTVATFPRKRVLNAWVVAGELPWVMQLQDEVERFALSQSCDEIVAPGCRFGWEKILPHHGWRERAMVWSHPVTGV